MLSAPVVVPRASGDHLYVATPDIGTPDPLRAEQAALLAVVNVAVYFASVNASPVQPVKVPLTFTLCKAGVSVRPGESLTVPLLPVHSGGV
jgi:hypothetical protein